MLMSRHIAPLGLLLILLSCNEETALNPLECRIQTFARKNTRESVAVTYELRASGEYQLNWWYYYGPQGRVNVENPQSPLIVTVTLGPNDSIYAGARGRVTEGSFRVSYRAVAADTLFEASDLCIQNLNATPILP